QGRLPRNRPADLVPRHGRAGFGQRAHLRRLERTDRLRRLRDLSRRRDRGRRRRRSGDPAGSRVVRRGRRRGARTLRVLGGERGRTRRGSARTLSAQRRRQGALRGLEEGAGLTGRGMFFYLSKTAGFFSRPSNVLIALAVLGIVLLLTRYARFGRRL